MEKWHQFKAALITKQIIVSPQCKEKTQKQEVKCRIIIIEPDVY
jgi:hypothetical protein